MAQINHVLIICGEASGDLHAANLAKALKGLNPSIKISGVGGANLRQAGAEIFYDIKGLSVIGLFDVLRKLPKFLALKKIILKKIESEGPQAIILVDFSGFNLRLAKAINKGVTVIYYISPQVWASRRGRIKTIRNYIHKIIVLFEFEREFYRKYAIDVGFCGHPLLDIVRPTMEKGEFLDRLGLSESKTTIALLPGSRKAEVENILPVMLGASKLILKKIPDAQFIIAKSPQVEKKLYDYKIKDLNINLKIVEDKAYDCLNAADFCLVCSGTATLETAIMQKPFVLIYKMGLLNYLLYLPQVKVPYIGMVNIVAKKKIIPEFIQFQANPKDISEEVIKILNSPALMARIRADLAQVKSSLGEKGASLKAAKIILDFLKERGLSENKPH